MENKTNGTNGYDMGQNQQDKSRKNGWFNNLILRKTNSDQFWRSIGTRYPMSMFGPQIMPQPDSRRVLCMWMKGGREQWRQMRQPGQESTEKSPSSEQVWDGLGWIVGQNSRFWIQNDTQVLVISEPSNVRHI